MFGLNNHAHPLCSGNLPDALCYLHSQLLLDLQAPSEHVHYARYFGEAQHVALGKVGHMTPSHKGQQVVLAHGVELNVLHQNHFTGVGWEQGVVHHVGKFLLVTTG